VSSDKKQNEMHENFVIRKKYYNFAKSLMTDQIDFLRENSRF